MVVYDMIAMQKIRIALMTKKVFFNFNSPKKAPIITSASAMQPTI